MALMANSLIISFTQECLKMVVLTQQPKETDGSMVAEIGWKS